MHKTRHLESVKTPVYILAWLVYILFSWDSVPVFGITVMLFSIALSMIGAWLYGYAGWLITTALTIPYHCALLHSYYDDPAIWHEAFNPFGITTQLILSGSIALLKSSSDRLEKLNVQLEEKVEQRAGELDRLQKYILQNHEMQENMLSHVLLHDIGKSLQTMLAGSGALLEKLIVEADPEAFKAARLNDLINNSTKLIQNLGFVDETLVKDDVNFPSAVRKLIDNLKMTTGTKFELNCEIMHGKMQKHAQQQLYRITREAVINAIRHAKAENITIHLRASHGGCHLKVVNDGLPMPAEVEEGLGMKLMRYRAQQLGGYIGWDAVPEGGTSVQCNILYAFE